MYVCVSYYLLRLFYHINARAVPSTLCVELTLAALITQPLPYALVSNTLNTLNMGFTSVYQLGRAGRGNGGGGTYNLDTENH